MCSWTKNCVRTFERDRGYPRTGVTPEQGLHSRLQCISVLLLVSYLLSFQKGSPKDSSNVYLCSASRFFPKHRFLCFKSKSTVRIDHWFNKLPKYKTHPQFSSNFCFGKNMVQLKLTKWWSHQTLIFYSFSTEHADFLDSTKSKSSFERVLD